MSLSCDLKINDVIIEKAFAVKNVARRLHELLNYTLGRSTHMVIEMQWVLENTIVR